MANTINSKPIVGGGLYSLRGGRIQPVQGPAPGVNVPASPMMAAPSPQQQGDNINLGDILMKGMAAYYGGDGQQQGAGNIFSMLKGLFGGKGAATGTGSIPSGSVQPGVNYSTLGRTYGM
jgi:hypothetical protein